MTKKFFVFFFFFFVLIVWRVLRRKKEKKREGKSIFRFISELIDGASLKGNILPSSLIFCLLYTVADGRESSASTSISSSINTNVRFGNFKLKKEIS